MKLIGQFVVAHPWQSLLLMTLLLLAGIADGIGLSAMLPMLNLAFEAGSDGMLALFSARGADVEAVCAAAERSAWPVSVALSAEAAVRSPQTTGRWADPWFDRSEIWYNYSAYS